jgi:hypothetical protein
MTMPAEKKGHPRNRNDGPLRSSCLHFQFSIFHSRTAHPALRGMDNYKWKMENDRKGTPSVQNTTFSIINSPFSIRATRVRLLRQRQLCCRRLAMTILSFS